MAKYSLNTRNACKVAEICGFYLDEWQKETLNIILEENEKGQWVNSPIGISLPRQNGKNAIVEVRELFGAVLLGEKIIHTAHQLKTAMAHFHRLQFFFGIKENDPDAATPAVNELVKTVRRTNGQEQIILKNGGSITVIARSRSSGRGLSADLVVADEAQAMDDEQQNALLPVISASANPQAIYMGTPPNSLEQGAVFTQMRNSLRGSRRWVEYSANYDDDINSPKTWAKANPGIKTGRLSTKTIQGELEAMSEASFRRERLGIWDKELDEFNGDFDFSIWRKTGIMSDAVPESDPFACLCLASDFKGETFAVAGCNNGHIELITLTKDYEEVAPILHKTKLPIFSLLSPVCQFMFKNINMRKIKTAEFSEGIRIFKEKYDKSEITHLIAGQNPLEIALKTSKIAPRGNGLRIVSPIAQTLPLEAVIGAVWGSNFKERIKKTSNESILFFLS